MQEPTGSHDRDEGATSGAANDAVARELADTAWLRRIARSLVRDDATADDVVQDACAAALRAGPDRPRSLRAWLVAVARNAARRARRDDVRRATREAVVARPEASDTEAQTAERLETARAIVEALEALDEPYRTALRLRWIDGLAPHEVAVRLGVSREAAWKRLSRGLALLRARLDRRPGGRAAWFVPAADLAGMRARDIPFRRVAVRALAARPLAATLAACALVGGLVTSSAWLGRDTEALTAVAGAAESVPNPVAESDARTGSPGAADDGTRRRGRARAPVAPATEVAVPSAADAAAALAPTTSPEPPPPPADRIVGRVLDPDGRPVADARVMRRDRGALTGTAGRTDARGRFVLPQPGVDAPGGELEVTTSAWAVTFAALARLRPGELDVGDIVTARRAPIEGVVVATDGRPVADACVILGSPRDGSQVGGSVVTGPDGAFRFDAAGPGTWRVSVMPREGPADWVRRHMAKDVVGGTRDLRFVVRRRAKFPARVRLEAVDAAGDAVPVRMGFPRRGFFVFQSASFDAGRTGASITYSGSRRGDAAQRAELTGVAPGEWIVWARSDGLGPTMTPLHVDLGDVELSHRVLLTPPGAVRVRVEFPAGCDAEATALVAVGGVPGPQWSTNADFGIGGWAKRGATSSWDLDGIAPATYTLTLFARGWTADAGTIDVVAGGVAEAVLVARPGGNVAWSPVVPEDHEAEIAFATEDGPYRVGCEILGTGAPQLLVLPAFPPGRLQWRVRVAEQDVIAAEDRRIATYTGEVTVVEGETVELPGGPFGGARGERSAPPPEEYRAR